MIVPISVDPANRASLVTSARLGQLLRGVVGATRSLGAAAAHDLPLRAINRLIEFHILKGVVVVPASLHPILVDSGRFRGAFAQREGMLASPLAEYDMTPAFVEEAFARGDDCYTLRDGDRLVSFSWYSRRSTPISEGLAVRLDPSWIYSYKSFTHPDYRGQRLHGITLSLALRSYADRGWRGAIGFVRSNNFPSRRSLARAGWRPFGAIVLVRILGRARGWATPGCRAYGVRLETIAARPPVGRPPAAG
jgi:hypothetical protein